MNCKHFVAEKLSPILFWMLTELATKTMEHNGIPPEIEKHILPHSKAFVLDFLCFQPPPVSTTTSTQLLGSYISNQPTNCNDIKDILLLPTPSTPVVQELNHLVHSAKSIMCPHVPGTNGKMFPKWIVSFWMKLPYIQEVHKKWGSAVSAVESRCRDKNTSEAVWKLDDKSIGLLRTLPWDGEIMGFQARINMFHLSTYLTKNWLSDEHLDQMLSLLQWDLANAHIRTQICLESPFFLVKLKNAYKDSEEYITEQGYQWIRQRGQDLALGKREKLGTIVNLGDNHWVAVVLDYNKGAIWYGDSLGDEVDEACKLTLKWWTRFHTGDDFKVWKMRTLMQQDGYSCGLLAWLALAAFFLKDQYQLVQATPNWVAEEQLKILCQVVDRHLENAEKIMVCEIMLGIIKMLTHK